MATPTEGARRPRFRARYLIALLYIGVALILVWMLSRPAATGDQASAPSQHAQAADGGATPAPAGRRPQSPR